MTSLPARWWLVALGALAVAFWGGMQVSGSPLERAPADAGGSVTRGRLAAPAALATPPPRGLTRDDLRDIVREELARAPATASPAAPVSPPADVDAAVTAAHAAVSDAIARGRWSEDDRIALRTHLVHLGPAETHEVLSPLFQAINAQRIQLDGPPI